MDSSSALVLVLLGLGGVAWYWLRKPSQGSASPGAVNVNYSTVAPAATWSPPSAAAPYLVAFRSTEELYRLPHNLLARQAQAESNYNPQAVSNAGAIGIMQIIPRWHPGVNAWDPIESIQYAGRLLRQYYDQFGSWAEALAAYNWGPTVLAQRGLQAAPVETVSYYTGILSDIGVPV